MNNKLLTKWSPIMEKLGVTDGTKREWLSEYAEFHSINENVGFQTLGTHVGMGAVVSPQPSGVPGQTIGSNTVGGAYGRGGSVGSGDYGQQLLPVAMKVAAHAIGLDLVAVKPTPGPVIDLVFVDYRYDDGVTDSDEYKPVVFKLKGEDAATVTLLGELTTELRAIITGLGVRETQGGLSQRMFFNLAENAGAGRAAGTVGAGLVDVLTEPSVKTGAVEFLGFSRIDKAPMFRAYRTTNTAVQGIWSFKADKNTFAEVEAVSEAFELTNGDAAPLASNTIGLGGGTNGANVGVELISALEDHITGYTSNFERQAGMTRDVDENTYPTVIGTNVTSKRVQVGTIEVSSAIKLTEMEDIQSQTGINIVEKMEGVLVNELSQKISRDIVDRIFSMGDENRKSAPNYDATQADGGTTLFDFDVEAYLGTNAPGGETSQALQRKLITKVNNASGYIATEGRVGNATFIVTNHTLASVLTEGANYQLNPASSTSAGNGQLYPAGKVNGISVYVDPYMTYSDNRILLGRKNNPDQPGVIFVPYLMAQTIKLNSEASKGAPRIFMRSRYAVTEVGFYPFKQYMTITVKDPANRLA